MKYQDLKKFAELLSEKNRKLEGELKLEQEVNKKLSSKRIELEQQLQTAQKIVASSSASQSMSHLSVSDFYQIYDFHKLCAKPITAIKLIRTLTGVGLKEAKDFYEDHMRPYFQSRGLDDPNAETLLDRVDRTPMKEEKSKPVPEPGYIPKDQATLGDILRQAMRENDG